MNLVEYKSIKYIMVNAVIEIIKSMYTDYHLLNIMIINLNLIQLILTYILKFSTLT